LNKSNTLLNNLEKIHSTELGILRIKQNIGLKTTNVVDWCKQKIKQADNIYREGKNWYVTIGGTIITVNAHSYTLITAHKI